MTFQNFTSRVVNPRATWPALVTLVVGVVLSFALGRKIADDEIVLTQQKIDLESHHVNDTITLVLGKRTKALQRFANLWALHDGMTDEEWDHVTSGFMADTPDLVGINWADRDGIVRRVSPAKFQKLVAGLDLARGDRADAFAEAKATQSTVATPLVLLKRGGIGFNVIVPLPGHKKGGYIVGVYGLAPLLEEVDHPGYQLRVRDARTDLSLTTATGGTPVPKFTQVVRISSELQDWEVDVIPLWNSIDLERGPFLNFAYIFGMTLSLLASVLVYLLGAWRRGNAGLRRAVSELKLYRLALDEATMVTIRSPDGILRSANDLFCEVTGFTRDELIGQHQRILDDPKNPATLSAADWVKVRSGQVWQGDMRHLRKNGTELHVAKTIVPCLDEKGKLYQFITIQSDVTARTQITDDFKHMIENMPGGAVLINAQGFFANRAVEVLTGYSRDQLGGIEDWFRLVHREHADEAVRSYRADNLREFSGSRVVPIVTAAGEVRTLNVYVYRDQKVEIWLLHDVTETLAAQERFRTIFEHSPDGQMIVDFADGACVILEANPALIRMVGLHDKSQIIGRSSNEFSAPFDQSTVNTPELFAERMARAALQHNEFEWDRVRNDGTVFPVRVTTSPVRIDGRTVILSTWHDLTFEKETQAKLVHSSKMQSLGEMSGGLAHELNTPLATIKGKVQHMAILARENRLEPGKLSDGLAKILHTTERISRIVNGLRHFAQNTEGEPVTAEHASMLIDDALAFCRARATADDVTLNVTLAQDAAISCRPWQITQAILNLLNNSLDAVHGRDEKWIEIISRVVNGGLEISVIDSGPGIAPAVRERMMQPFFTTKPVGQGTGLGLSVSRGIIESHGGELKFDHASANTAFVIRLPIEAVAVAQPGDQV